MSEEEKQILSPEQVRVLASLMEKHLATPKNYPLTPNSLTLACNQKSNRHPVMAMEEGKVVSHRAPGMLKVTREEQALLAMLMLREPLTLNDLKARTEKMIGFESVDEVHASVKQLMSRSPALVLELPVAVGQREQRYTHLLAGEPDLSSINVKVSKPASSSSQAQKIAELEKRIERLETALDMAWGDHEPS